MVTINRYDPHMCMTWISRTIVVVVTAWTAWLLFHLSVMLASQITTLMGTEVLALWALKSIISQGGHRGRLLLMLLLVRLSHLDQKCSICVTLLEEILDHDQQREFEMVIFCCKVIQSMALLCHLIFKSTCENVRSGHRILKPFKWNEYEWIYVKHEIFTIYKFSIPLPVICLETHCVQEE